jgi:ribonucleoside-triphosphate reductase
MLAVHLGRELHEGDALVFAKRVVRRMHALVEQAGREMGLNFVLTQARDEHPAERLARLDHGMFADRLVARGDRSKGEVYYTHASWVREDVELPLAQRLGIEGEFHPLCRGGALSVIPVKEQEPAPEALAELSRRISRNTGLRFWSYSRVVG